MSPSDYLESARQEQLARDEARIERAQDRKQHRAESALVVLNQEVLAELKRVGSKLAKGKRKQGKLPKAAPVGVLHLSDLHFGETISAHDNQFDIEIACKRLQKYVERAKCYMKANGVQKVVLAMGGDMLNSDRRLDEILTQATNRSRVMVLATHVLAHVIMDLRADFFVDVLSVTGNEGRAKQELCWSDPGVTDSYDASIYWCLESILTQQKDKGLRMLGVQGNAQVFTAGGQTFGLLHGHQVKAHDQRQVQAIVGRYSQAFDVQLDYVLCGHIHAAFVGDRVGRSSSLSGGNAYSGDGLQFSSIASQNCYVARPDGIEKVSIDLQNYEGFDGYPIQDLLSEHQAKSSQSPGVKKHDC